MATEAWIVPTVDDLSAYLAASGMTALREAALAVGQDDPFEEHMPSVVAKVRAYIKGCKSNVLSETENSIPRSLKGITCLLIIEAMEGRLPGVSLTERQSKALERGIDDLKMVASCDLPVTSPDDPMEDNTQTGPDAYVVSSTELTTLRSQTAGL